MTAQGSANESLRRGATYGKNRPGAHDMDRGHRFCRSEVEYVREKRIERHKKRLDEVSEGKNANSDAYSLISEES